MQLELKVKIIRAYLREYGCTHHLSGISLIDDNGIIDLDVALRCARSLMDRGEDRLFLNTQDNLSYLTREKYPRSRDEKRTRIRLAFFQYFYKRQLYFK